ncbi:hypothetical protein H0H87_006106 [Tephrocybe sp. NHM501043]|nr:hypothetical protein H0H87_006106 [Tephrocybe sp. NHM501043]
MSSLNGPSRGVSTSAENLVALGNKHVTRGLGRLTEGILARGQGSYVEYEDGKKLLDFSTGIGVTCLVVPHASLDSFFFWNSGSEAIEAAIKIARASTGRQNIIAMQGEFCSCVSG